MDVHFSELGYFMKKLSQHFDRSFDRSEIIEILFLLQHTTYDRDTDKMLRKFENRYPIRSGGKTRRSHTPKKILKDKRTRNLRITLMNKKSHKKR